MAVLVALGTVLATFLGGFLALRARKRMHLVLGLSAGLLLGLVSFDLIPEVFELSSLEFGHVPAVMVMFVVGFLALHILERYSGAHEPHGSKYNDGHEHSHNTTGVIAASAMVIHVFLDGLAIGTVTIAASAFAIISYLVGNFTYASYLQIIYVPHVGELAVVCSAFYSVPSVFAEYIQYCTWHQHHRDQTKIVPWK